MINAFHIGVVCPEYCGFWHAQLFIQVSVPATYCCKKTDCFKTGANMAPLLAVHQMKSTSPLQPNEEYHSITITLVVKSNLFFLCKSFTCLREQTPIQFYLIVPRAKFPRCCRCTEISRSEEKLLNKTWLSGSSMQSNIFRKNLGSHPFYR